MSSKVEPCAVKIPFIPEQKASFITSESPSVPISSAHITFGAILLINIFIPITLGTLSSISVLIPISFCGIPLYNDAISPLSSTTPTI